MSTGKMKKLENNSRREREASREQVRYWNHRAAVDLGSTGRGRGGGRGRPARSGGQLSNQPARWRVGGKGGGGHLGSGACWCMVLHTQTVELEL